MNGDLAPAGGHRRRPDPEQAEKIRKGGIQAQIIKKETTELHKKIDIPKAEELLLQGLEEVEDSNIESAKK